MTTTCATTASALDIGLRLTTMGSTTVTGFEVSSSGGSFFGKKMSVTLAPRVFQTGSSLVGSSTASGCEVSSSGGSFLGKKTS